MTVTKIKKAFVASIVGLLLVFFAAVIGLLTLSINFDTTAWDLEEL